MMATHFTMFLTLQCFLHYVASNKKQTWPPMAETLNFTLEFLQFLAFKHKFVDYNDQNRGLYIIICWNMRQQDVCFLVSGLFQLFTFVTLVHLTGV